MTQGFGLQPEAHTVAQGTRLSYSAAYLAISKDEWGSLLDEYRTNHLAEPSSR